MRQTVSTKIYDKRDDFDIVGFPLYVNGIGSITSVGEERASLSAIVYFKLCVFCSESSPLPPGDSHHWISEMGNPPEN